MIYKKYEEQLKTLVFVHYGQPGYNEYAERINKIMHEFKKALFVSAEVENHPRAEKLYELVYANYHSGGLPEIELAFMEYSEVLK